MAPRTTLRLRGEESGKIQSKGESSVSFIIKMNDPFGNERYWLDDGSSAWVDDQEEAKRLTKEEATEQVESLFLERGILIKQYGPKYKKMKFKIIDMGLELYELAEQARQAGTKESLALSQEYWKQWDKGQALQEQLLKVPLDPASQKEASPLIEQARRLGEQGEETGKKLRAWYETYKRGAAVA
jgi:hypothetical protein